MSVVKIVVLHFTSSKNVYKTSTNRIFVIFFLDKPL